MKIATFLLILATPFLSYARAVIVGDTTIEIPTPSGFVRVTPEMTGVKELQKHFVPATNELLVQYIAEEDAPIALEGNFPKLTRRFSVQVEKKISERSLTSSEFVRFKALFRSSMEERLELIKDRFDLTAAGKGVSQLFDVETVIKLGGIVPMKSHAESALTISSSMLMGTS